MPKILYLITQSEFGGAQRYVFDLASNLKSHCQLAVALGEQGKNGKLAKLLQENQIQFFTLPHLKRSISPINDLLAMLEIAKLIKQYQPDIIHLNSSKISILGSLAVFLIRIFAIRGIRINSRIRIIYTVHGWVFNEPLPLPLKWFYLYAEKFAARFKHKIICVSEHDQRLALKHRLAPAEKLVTIHNGLAPINFYSRDEAKKMLPSPVSGLRSPVSGLRSPVSSLLIGSLGHLYKTKGYEYFVEAASILISSIQYPVSFIIIGEGGERKKLENLIAKYNLQNNFLLTGSIDDAAKLLPALDIYACSSVKEGLPYSILEAMRAGLAIVAANVGGVPEMIENNKTGLLTKPADPQDLAEKIKTLLDNKTLVQELGQRAQTRVAIQFSLEKMLEQTEKVYNE
jgi:glycosyltransferase involved in cell wall biosynthesis